MRTEGSELINRIHAGQLRVATSPEIQKVRGSIIQACTELLDVGARIRPLYLAEKRVGWVRGVHLTERRVLERWIFDEHEFLEQTLLLGTSCSREFLDTLNTAELRSMARLVTQMTESDVHLYPYISAFVTTSASEQLWFSQGTEITAYRNRVCSTWTVQRTRGAVG